jgi:2-polyprenyl-3-methyl-5-hydroxy-6-metoxy-1,4-benzoquinol methylase
MSGTLTLISCPACGHDKVTDDKIYNGYLLKKCSVCGFIFTAERNFSTSQYEDVYSSVTSYHLMINDACQTFEGKKGFRELWWFKRKALNWLNERIPSGRILDLGSGPGTLLMVARRDFGYDVRGVEPSSAAAAIANRYGVPTFCGTVEEFASQNSDKFDAITSFEVLEHVTDPLSFLVTARYLLKREGVLLLSMPNLDDPYCLRQQITPAMPPIHVNFFARRSLGSLLERAGFAMQRVYTLPIPSSTVRNIYGPKGFIMRLPYLAVARLMGRVDGTTLLVMATPLGG